MSLFAVRFTENAL